MNKKGRVDDKVLAIRMSKGDQARIERAAKKGGFHNVTEYVRQVLKADVDKKLSKNPPSASLDELKSLIQILREANI
jgi:Arc/MetJ-type ribon-helix-helix transcriptional regulator